MFVTLLLRYDTKWDAKSRYVHGKHLGCANKIAHARAAKERTILKRLMVVHNRKVMSLEVRIGAIYTLYQIWIITFIRVADLCDLHISRGNKPSTPEIFTRYHRDICISPTEAYVTLMFYTFTLFVVSLLIALMPAEAQPERYWSGRPQAIGIDLSIQYM